MTKETRTNKMVEVMANNMGVTYEEAVAFIEKAGVDVNASIITQNELAAAVVGVQPYASARNSGKRYFIHTERKDKATHVNNNAMPFYEDIATMCGMEGKKVWFGFGEAMVNSATSYYDVCAASYNACKEGGVVYLFEYDAPASGDVGIHNFDYWMEYLHEVQSMFCNKEDALDWARLIAANKDKLSYVGEVNEVVFHQNSNVRLVAKMECKNEEQCRFVYNYIADKYGLAIHHEDIAEEVATMADFTFAEWRHISKYVKVDGNGMVISKKTGLAIAKNEIIAIKNWVARHVF